MKASKAAVSSQRAVRTSKRADKSSPASTQCFMESILWKKIYMSEFCKNKKQIPKFLDALKMESEDHVTGYWKSQYFKTIATRDLKKWKRLLGPISFHTGLPSQTEQVLRNLRVAWELTVTSTSGHESTLELSCSHFSETSVTLCWSAGCYLPNYEQISTLQLHGVRRITPNCPSLKKRSLMLRLDMHTLNKNAQTFGQDSLVQMKLLQPGVIVGVWRDQCSVAFITFTLHIHRLVERSSQGSSACTYVEPIVKPPFDDTDPEYGLHGYQLHIVLHNTVCKVMSESFSQLFCRRAQISDGLVQFTAVNRTNLSQHIALSGTISLPWQCEALQGTVENCCIMSLTLLDEFRKPFRCATSPVSMELDDTSVCYDYDGDQYMIHYQDSGIQVKMQLVQLKDQKQVILISLVVFLSVGDVNKHFSRDY
ncbi:F-box only protein 15 isoform X2 [Cololabis saira]|uniref:F-box only protein 15 isoform X2 n=1 Tax=Cololabis saira TaxID=129043 RepID=UPI002AD4098A|nr:F-box only protein 15 isoform X2 [Cololabis saira]